MCLLSLSDRNVKRNDRFTELKNSEATGYSQKRWKRK